MRCKFCPCESVYLYADRRCESFIIKDYKCPECGAYCHTTWTKGSSKEVVEVRE